MELLRLPTSDLPTGVLSLGLIGCRVLVGLRV